METELELLKKRLKESSESGTVKESYDKAMQNLESSRVNDLRELSAEQELINKYLPQQIKASGLGGVGMNEQTLLQSQNNYVKNRSSINQGYAAERANLEVQRDQAVATDSSNALAEIKSLLTGDTEKDAAMIESYAKRLNSNDADSAVNYAGYANDTVKANNSNSAITAIKEVYDSIVNDEGKYSADELKSYVESYGKYMSEDAKAQANAYVEALNARQNSMDTESATKAAKYAEIYARTNDQKTATTALANFFDSIENSDASDSYKSEAFKALAGETTVSRIAIEREGVYIANGTIYVEGSKITDDKAISMLNYMATGDKGKSPDSQVHVDIGGNAYEYKKGKWYASEKKSGQK